MRIIIIIIIIHSSSSLSLSLLSIIIVSIFELARSPQDSPPLGPLVPPCRAWVGGYRRVTQRGFHREIPAGQRRQHCQPTAKLSGRHGMAPPAASRRRGGHGCLEHGGHPRAQRRSGASTLCTCATLLRAPKAPLAPLHVPLLQTLRSGCFSGHTSSKERPHRWLASP